MEHEATKVNKGHETRRATHTRANGAAQDGPGSETSEHARWSPSFAVIVRLRVFALLTLLLVLVTACSAGPTSTPAPTRLRITGSTALTPAVHEIAAAFQAENPNILIEVQGGDSANGWVDLRAGRADIAAVSWTDETRSAPSGYRLVPVARDAIAVIVHPNNPISNVTALQLRALFAGEILDWARLGGPEGEPMIVSREEGSGTRASFEARVMGDRRVTLNAIVMPSTQAVGDYVAAHRLAVGYVTLDAVDDRVRAIPLEGLAPSKDAAGGGYHLVRVLSLAVPDPPSRAVQAFLDFAEGPAGVAIWDKHFAAIR